MAEAKTKSGEKARLEIRKYPNRRLYDVTRSQHLTADQLYELIRAGHDVVVIDSASGADITHQILTQMILERDSSKLEVFPATLLHEIIRANQRMWKSFAEQWMAGLSRLVAEQASAYAQRMAEIGRAPLDASAWNRLFGKPPREGSDEPGGGGDDLRDAVRRLETEVKRLARGRRPRQRRS
jgi:polyhydroxyalkanoate synthesis repressor PhaR